MDRIKMLRRVLALVGVRVERRLVAELEYLREENRVLKRILGDRRPPLTDAERIRLAVKAKALARDVLERIATIVKPKTLRDWHRRLVERRAASPRPARRIAGERLRELVPRFAKENPGWGCRRIQGALANLGVHVGYRTVARILAREGVAPPPTRPTSWRTFIRAEAEVLAAADFFTVPVWTIRGIVAHHVLFVIDIGTRAVEILGVTTRPNAHFVEQVGRRLVDRARGFLRGKQWLVMDRDRKFTFGFRRIFARTGIEVIRTAPRAPNMNAYAERFVRSIKTECLDQLIFVGEQSLRRALQQYLLHYNAERNHQGIGNRRLTGEPEPRTPVPRIATRRRLGGLLNYYHDADAAAA